ncbi:LysR family transcriptional regulator [Pantoea agglomerans]|nr:LysR family transcriptional regulator [Pantoea agglomerans]PEI04001.1 LysR family transcriptional regulator [Pantoea agglomerans]
METKLSQQGNNNEIQKNDSKSLSINNVDLKLLRVFKCVVESGGFTSASNELNIGLAAISKQISDLEIRLGMTLCTRGRDGFLLTEHGINLYNASLELFTSIDQFRDKLYSTRNEILGDLNIGVVDNTITDSQFSLTTVVRNFHINAPKVNMRLQTLHLEEIERGLMEGRLDCAIAPVYSEKEDYIYSNLYTEYSELYCGAGHPLYSVNLQHITPEVLQKTPVINHTYASAHHKNSKFNFSSSRIQATQVEAVSMLILTGCFIGYLPKHYAERFVAEGKMRAIGNDELNVTARFCFMIKRGRKLNKVIKLFMNELGVE